MQMQKSQCDTLKNVSCKGPPVPNNANAEIQICVFYENILKELCLASDQNFYFKIRESLKNIRSYKNRDVEEHGTVLFEVVYDRLAYIFAYGVIHSVIIYDRLLSMLKHNQTLVKKIIRLEKINICILGGGPGFEAVSVCKLFSSILVNYKDIQRPPLEVHVTVVDMCIGWKKDAELIVSSAQNDLCDPNNVQIHFKFIEADLTTDFIEEVKKALKAAHFVTMCMFLSDVNEASYSKQEITAMISKIIESMSYKSCLFFLDTSGGGLFTTTDKFIDGQPSTARIYGPCLHNCHLLSLETIQHFSDALIHIFRFLKCTSRSKISCSAWVKVRNIVNLSTFSYNNTRSDPFETSDRVIEPKLKKTKKHRMKRVLQSPVKLKELYCSDVGTENEDSE